jgi:uncharacterized phage protein gp47/JayE
MSFTRPTLLEIYGRIKADMESRVTAGIPIPRVSLLGILAIVQAGASHLQYGFIQWIVKQIFPDTADIDIGLPRWGARLKLPRKAPQYATGFVAFTGTASHTVDEGTLFQNADGYEYETLDDFVIGTDTSVEAQSVEAGAAYNTDAETFTLSTGDADIDDTVTAVSGFDDGADIETKEAWVYRILQRLQNPPSSGSVSDYVRWALSRTGVGRAWCIPGEEYLGGGTVGVGLSTETLGAVSASVIADVAAYIDTVRPIPAAVTVFSASPVPVIFNMNLQPNTTEMQEAIEANLDEMFITEADMRVNEIKLSHIRAAIGAAGPDDYELTDITVGGVSIGVTNIATTRPGVAVLNNVIYSEF